MIRLLIRAGIFLASAALGLLVASWVLDGFRLRVGGFVTAIVVFAIAQSVLAPFIFTMARKYAPAMLGGIGLVSTFVALLIASLFPGGLSIAGVTAWILGTLIVWLITALGGWILPLVFLKEKVRRAGENSAA
ncbi:phage holin family protein [Specibacter cremeus]|uniref:phage holin family protein n=1 Tax=Specibacter cremeus TaxID=1629051 RepID=UPI000F7A0179|nr:phage holin family protein [Specibacter cremeus]